MIRKIGFSVFAAAACFAPLLAPTPAQAQLWTWSKEQMLEYTKAWTGDRFPDGRPKVPDSFLQRAKALSAEEMNNVNYGGAQAGPAAGRGPQGGPGAGAPAAGRGPQGGPGAGAAASGRGPQGGPGAGAAASGRGPQGGPGAGAAAGGRGGAPQGGFGGRGAAATSGVGGGYNQYTEDWQLTQPGKTMAGRVVTMQLMPVRPDLDSVVNAKAREKGIANLNSQYILDMLQPGDVLVVDLMGMKDGGAILNDTLAYYVMRATQSGGLVVNGSISGVAQIAGMDMPAYYKEAHTPYTTGFVVAGYNTPVTIGNVVVMPGDLAVGDREGVTFVPPQAAGRILDAADTTHIHDEWTKKKFDEGKYKSSEIYSNPREQSLRQEYQQYLNKRLEELRNGKK